MSATGHERRRREQATERVMAAVRDVRAFVHDEGLPCEPTREALAQYLRTHDRVTLDAMAGRVIQRPSAPDSITPEPLQKAAETVAGRRVDISGPWMKVRAQVRDVLGLQKVPASKDEAEQMLKAAGYEVTHGES